MAPAFHFRHGLVAHLFAFWSFFYYDEIRGWHFIQQASKHQRRDLKKVSIL